MALTVVCASVVSMIGERMTWPPGDAKMGMPLASGSKLDFTASISMTTSPSGLIRG